MGIQKKKFSLMMLIFHGIFIVNFVSRFDEIFINFSMCQINVNWYGSVLLCQLIHNCLVQQYNVAQWFFCDIVTVPQFSKIIFGVAVIGPRDRQRGMNDISIDATSSTTISEESMKV